jgi:hypothetical protein
MKNGRRVREHSQPWHVRGATKFYRADCWREIAPLPTILGWDTIDEVRAQLRGWKIRCVTFPEKDTLHMRPTGSYDGRPLRGARRKGVAAWAYGAHPANVLASSVVRMREKPRILGGLAYLAGWLGAAARRLPRAEPEVVRFVRRGQLSHLGTYALPTLALGAALLTGTAIGAQPKLALGAIACIAVMVLAFRAPVANLTALIFLTAVVPYGILNRFSVGGGVDSPGLLPSDLFLVAGLSSAALMLPSHPLDRLCRRYALLMSVFLAVVGLELGRALMSGPNRSIVGQEGRVLLGLGTFLIALPLLTNARARRRLIGALSVVGVALGAWGMLQWFGHFSFGAAGDVGVRSGVRLTSNGTGQLQGGEFAFPVAIVVCFAALMLGEVRSRLGRAALLAAILLNAASCLVTFERSFWIDAIVGIGFVTLAAPAARRLKLLAAVCSTAVLAFGALALLAPSTLTTAQQRLNSIATYAHDDSVRYRLVESRFVSAQVREHPLAGAGLGASIFWGQPWASVPPKTRTYSHDGYLWISWKLGIPAAALLVLLLTGSVLSWTRPGEEPLSRAVRRGAQGAIAGLLVATFTFPSFSQLSIAPVIGLLLALAITPQVSARRSRGASYRRELAGGLSLAGAGEPSVALYSR